MIYVPATSFVHSNANVKLAFQFSRSRALVFWSTRAALLGKVAAKAAPSPCGLAGAACATVAPHHGAAIARGAARALSCQWRAPWCAAAACRHCRALCPAAPWRAGAACARGHAGRPQGQSPSPLAARAALCQCERTSRLGQFPLDIRVATGIRRLFE
jgi:hypothetical protein